MKQKWWDEFESLLHFLQVQVTEDTLNGHIDGTDESFKLVKEIKEHVKTLLENV